MPYQSGNRLDGNGVIVLVPDTIVSFYMARYNNNIGNILTSATFGWAANPSGGYFPVGYVNNNSLRINAGGALNWSGYDQGGPGQSNATYTITWPNAVVDNLTHHYLFYTSGGQIKLYIDGKLSSTQSVPSRPPRLNLPFGIGTLAPEVTTEQAGPLKFITNQDGTYFRSYGRYLNPDVAVGILGQLWIGPAQDFTTGHVFTEQEAIGNFWQNGYVDLGGEGTRGVIHTLQPQIYEDFGYAGGGYLARTGLATRASVTANDIRIKTAASNLTAQATVIARGVHDADFLSRFRTTSQLTAQATKIQQNSATFAVSSLQTAVNTRLKNASLDLTNSVDLTSTINRFRTTQVSLDSQMTISADLIRVLYSAYIQAQTTLTAQASIVTNTQAAMTAQVQTTAEPTRQRVSEQALTASFQQSSNLVRIVQEQGALTSQFQSSTSTQRIRINSAILQAQVQINQQASKIARTDIQLTSQAALTTQARGVFVSTINLQSQAIAQVIALRSRTTRVNLQVQAFELATGTRFSIDPRLQIKIEEESRQYLITPEDRQLAITSDGVYKITPEDRILAVNQSDRVNIIIGTKL